MKSRDLNRLATQQVLDELAPLCRPCHSGVLGDLGYSFSNISTMPLFLGPGDGAIVTAVVGLGGVGIVKIKYVPRREPLRRSGHARARDVRSAS